MDTHKKPPPSQSGAPEDIGALAEHLRRLHEQMLVLSQTSRGKVADQVQRVAQELESVTASLEQLERGRAFSDKSKTKPTSSLSSPLQDDSTHSQNIFQFDSHLVTDVKGLIQLADQSATRVFDLPPHLIIGKNLLDLLSPNDRFVLQQHLRKLEDGESGLEWEMSLSPIGKEPLNSFITMSALRMPDGTVSSVHWLIRDRSAFQRAMGRDQLIQALGEQVLEGRSLPELLSHVCQHFVQLFAYPLVWFGVQEPDGEVKVVAKAGSHPSHIQKVLELSESDVDFVKAVFESPSLRVLRKQDADWSADHFAERYGLGSSLFVPLRSQDKVLGVFVVAGFGSEAFDPLTMSWFEKLAGQIAVSLLLVKEYEHLRVRGAAIASAEHAVFITDPDGRIEWVNEAYTRLTGFGVSELIGTKPKFLKSGKLRTAMQQAHRQSDPGQFWRHELVEQRKDGRTFMVEQVFTPLRNDDGRITHFVAIHQDITVRKETEAKFFHLAHHDPLTDLPNRIMFFDRLKQALGQARRHNRSVGVIFLDLDRFKSVNDTFGHDIGDDLLRTVADRLTQCVRGTDTVARLSGDEFTMILQDLERGQDAGHVAQKILDTLSQPIELGGRPLAAHASLGIALYPFDAKDPDSLLAQADRGMYRAKEKGGNCYQFVSEELNAQAFERLVVEKSLQKAWERKEFLLHYQPEVDLNTGNLVGMEALLRWQHPELGLIFPHQFLAQAEDVRFFASLQEWVLRQTCAQSQEWKSMDLPSCPMAVNLSLHQQDSHGLLDIIHTVIQETGFDPKALILEIPQSLVLEAEETVVPFVQKVTSWGMTCILDDVSESDSLATTLDRIPFHRIKLASSLVENIPHLSEAVEEVERCMLFARTAGLPIIANGVESADQITFLREHGCHQVQGYLCSRPLPADEMTELLRGWWGSEF